MKKLGPAGTGPEKWTIDAKKDWKKKNASERKWFLMDRKKWAGKFYPV